jgi:hypothetical protein
MRYLVKARVKPGQSKPLAEAIKSGELGRGSVAGGEYLRNMRQARVDEGGVAQWVEACFCATPLDEERPYWEKYFELLSIKDAHARRSCEHENGSRPWACRTCDCTARLEARLKESGKPFLEELHRETSEG